jgi:hypothetical protein
VPTYADTFPDWEVVFLPPSNYAHMREFEFSMKRNKGRWFMPDFEQDNNLIQMVDHYFDEWVGQVSETVFDVNCLVLDEENVIFSAYNKPVFDFCRQHRINPIISELRHSYFWDGGISCCTQDLRRKGGLERYL